MKKAVLRMHCRDQKGIVHFVSGLIYKKMRGNIVSLQEMKITPDQDGKEPGLFFLRLAFEMEKETTDKALQNNLTHIERKFKAVCRVDNTEKKWRLALFATNATHCLIAALAAGYESDLNAEISLIISNHNSEKVIELAKMFNIPFHCVPFDSKSMKAKERVDACKRQLSLLDKYNVEVIGLARYMQLIDPSLVKRYPNRIVNIHHSFLPAFKGATPYHQAFNRGVKNIGATAHFVTNELDEGPIIDQDTAQVEVETSVNDFIQAGKAIEKRVFLRALKKFTEFKTIVFKNKVVVFK
jgi:formyltetrahydrofolate deformylase